MKIKVLFLTSIVFLLFGCRPILMKMYGIKKPKIENEKTLIKKTLKLGLDTSNIVTVGDNEFINVLRGQKIPDGAIYDKNGKYIEYRQHDSACNAGLFDFIPRLNNDDKYHQPDSSDLYKELKKFRTLKGDTLKNLGNADFYLLIYWTVWTGRLNKDHVAIWEELANKNKNCKIKVIKVNLDLHEYWDTKKREKIIRAISKKKKK